MENKGGYATARPHSTHTAGSQILSFRVTRCESSLREAKGFHKNLQFTADILSCFLSKQKQPAFLHSCSQKILNVQVAFIKQKRNVLSNEEECVWWKIK